MVLTVLLATVSSSAASHTVTPGTTTPTALHHAFPAKTAAKATPGE